MKRDRTVVDYARRVAELQHEIPCVECGAVPGQRCTTRGLPHPARTGPISAAFQLGAEYARFRK